MTAPPAEPAPSIAAEPRGAGPGAHGGRLVALDVLRGLTVVGMLVVNNPGDEARAFVQLRHAPWHGLRLADLVFPFFLAVVGVTTHLSLAGRAARGADDGAVRRQILRRAAWLVAIGVLLNWYPFYRSGAIPGIAHPDLGDRLVGRLLELRLPGVLQRIGIAYAIGALLAWRASARRVALLAAALLLGHWALLTLLPVPGTGGVRGAALLDQPARTLAAWCDRLLLDWRAAGLGVHLWPFTPGWDPEGVLGTIPAVGTVLVGVLAGRWLGGRHAPARRVGGLAAGAAGALALGLAWSVALPLNKQLWTGSFVLVTAGLAGLLLAGLLVLLPPRGDGTPPPRWTSPFLDVGVNPIAAYVGASLLERVLRSSVKLPLDGRKVGTGRWVTEWLARGGVDARVASLAWSLCVVALCWLGLRAMRRRGIVWRI